MTDWVKLFKLIILVVYVILHIISHLHILTILLHKPKSYLIDINLICINIIIWIVLLDHICIIWVLLAHLTRWLLVIEQWLTWLTSRYLVVKLWYTWLLVRGSAVVDKLRLVVWLPLWFGGLPDRSHLLPSWLLPCIWINHLCVLTLWHSIRCDIRLVKVIEAVSTLRTMNHAIIWQISFPLRLWLTLIKVEGCIISLSNVAIMGHKTLGFERLTVVQVLSSIRHWWFLFLGLASVPPSVQASWLRARVS